MVWRSVALAGVDRSVALTFGPDGNLYVASHMSPNFDGKVGAVLRYDGRTGAFIDTFVSAGDGGLSGPMNLIFTPNQVPVREPSGLTLVGVGAVGLLAYLRQRRRAV